MKVKFPHQRVFFASWNRTRDIRALNELLVSMSNKTKQKTIETGILIGTTHTDIAKSHPLVPEMNVLVIGMPNVGKSTLLNALRNIGISGREFIMTTFYIYTRLNVLPKR